MLKALLSHVIPLKVPIIGHPPSSFIRFVSTRVPNFSIKSKKEDKLKRSGTSIYRSHNLKKGSKI